MPTFSARASGIAYPEGLASAATLPAVTKPEDKLVPSDLISTVKGIEPGNFLFDRRFVPGISDLIASTQFIEIPELGKTREENGHHVVFGQLLLNAKDDGEHSILVALKPFDKPQEAAREFAVAGYISSGQIDGLDTFTPLGLHRLSDTGQRAVITRYRHPVRSLDTIFWNPDIVDNLDAQENVQIIVKAMGRAAMSLAAIHNNNWVHGDPQAKNIVWDVTSGKTIVSDLEEMSPFPCSNGSVDIPNSRKLVDRDLWIFIGSVFRNGTNHELLRQMLMQHFSMPYAGSRYKGAAAKLTPQEINGMIDTESKM